MSWFSFVDSSRPHSARWCHARRRRVHSARTRIFDAVRRGWSGAVLRDAAAKAAMRSLRLVGVEARPDRCGLVGELVFERSVRARRGRGAWPARRRRSRRRARSARRPRLAATSSRGTTSATSPHSSASAAESVRSCSSSCSARRWPIAAGSSVETPRSGVRPMFAYLLTNLAESAGHDVVRRQHQPEAAAGDGALHGGDDGLDGQREACGCPRG